MKTILAELETRFGATGARFQRDDLASIDLPADRAVPAVTWLKQHTPFVQLNHMSVVDWLEDGQFQVTWLMTDPHGCRSIMVNTRIDREQATCDSVADLWPQAVTYEQEINEMYGIDFPGSPRMGVPFILEGWNDMPPMRRDFDTVKYVAEHHPHRPGRRHHDPRTYIGERFGEKGYLHD